jgi:hypothetical protein
VSGHCGNGYRSLDCGHGCGCRRVHRRVVCAREPVDEVIWRPWTGDLHLALLHGRGGGGELVLVALDALALDQVRDVEDHFAVFREAAGNLFVERIEETTHLEADCTATGLALALAGGILAQVREVFAADALSGKIAAEGSCTAIVDEDLDVHLGFAAKLINIRLKLALIGADGFAEEFVRIKDGPKSEWKNGGMLKTVCDHSCMIDSRSLIEAFCRIVFAYDDCEVTCRVKENLISADPVDLIKGNWFTMSG